MLTEEELSHFWRYCLMIESDLEATARFIDFQVDNYTTFSAEYSKIILLSCSEIDLICRLLCREIEPNFNERNSNFEKYTEIILNRLPKINECKLSITYNKSDIKPFEVWEITPYTSPAWWKDYQGIKHSRYSNFRNANLQNALSSVAGLIVLNLYLYRLVMNKAYANPYPHPRVFDSEYFSPYFLCRAKEELPDFEPK